MCCFIIEMGGVNQTYIGQNNGLVFIFDVISLVNQEMLFESVYVFMCAYICICVCVCVYV